MTATPPSRTATPESPVVSRGKNRGTAGRSLIRRWPSGGDAINRIARQVRDPRGGSVHAIDGRGFDDKGFHYLTDCQRLLWAARGAVLSTWPVDCPACREMAA